MLDLNYSQLLPFILSFFETKNGMKSVYFGYIFTGKVYFKISNLNIYLHLYVYILYIYRTSPFLPFLISCTHWWAVAQNISIRLEAVSTIPRPLYKLEIEWRIEGYPKSRERIEYENTLPNCLWTAHSSEP